VCTCKEGRKYGSMKGTAGAGVQVVAVWVFWLIGVACGAVLDFEELGGIVNVETTDVAKFNADLFASTLEVIQPFDRLVFPADKLFFMMGGIKADNVTDVVISVDGTIKFSDDIGAWPAETIEGKLHYEECMFFTNFRNVTFTSASVRGVVDGNGNRWWNIAFLGYLLYEERRPRLLHMDSCENILIEYLLLVDSPYWTTKLEKMDGLEIRFSDISARRTRRNSHNILDLTAFNTDGFDFTGKNVYVHDSTVYSQDDCFTVKDNSQDMVIERVNASGVGLTIGSIGGGSLVRNITFRDSILHNSHKGIYMKFRNTRSDPALVEDVLYENIIMDNIEQWPIWIGPAQQSDTTELCYANPCSICWPTVPGAECFGMPNSTYRNVVFRNVLIRNPQGSPGVILADENFPMDGIIFEDVRVDTCADDLTSFVDTFPILDEFVLVHDRFVTYFAIIVFLAVVLGVTPCVVCVRKGCLTKSFWEERRLGFYFCLGFLACLVIFLIILMSWFAHISIQTGSQDSYYVCKGVTNGIALGSTWPVPSCFEDQTTDGGNDCRNVHPAAVVVPVLFFLFVGVGIFIYVKKYRNKNESAEKTVI